jgi:hypothetical protein
VELLFVRQIEFYKYTDAKSLLFLPPEIAEILYLCLRETFCCRICRRLGHVGTASATVGTTIAAVAAAATAPISVTATIAVSAAAIAATLWLFVVCSAAASVSPCHHRCLPPLLLLLSAGAFATVATAATAAPIPSAAIIATATYFSDAGSAASMFPPLLPLFPLLPRTTASLSVATAPLLLFPMPSPP